MNNLPTGYFHLPYVTVFTDKCEPGPDADKSEREAMLGFLATNPCPQCGGACQLSGSVLYTGPLRWEWKCPSGHHGTVGYAHIPHVSFAADGQKLVDNGPISFR